MMRAFLACRIPDEVLAYIYNITSLLPKASLIIPKQHDLTIKFLGDISEETIQKVAQKLSSIDIKPFQANLSSPGVFSEQMIRVVWIGVEPFTIFNLLHAKVEKVLDNLFPQDERFIPHITLARTKGVRDRKAFIDHLHNITIEPILFTIDRLLLIKSELTYSGAIHTPLLELPF